MEHHSNLPTAEEIASLSEAVRRDPASDAFVALGERLLALGRPRDAIEVGARGLRANPGQLAGRLMVARAFAALHQWKEAQAELLKVVKVDRQSAAGFALLGEVLMRRSDYERALPVLQHAQNLAPADPQVMALLRRARAGQPLDPPAPIPAPRAPVPAGSPGPGPGRPDSAFDEAPTYVADGAALGRVDLMQRPVERRGPAAPMERTGERVQRDARGRSDREERPVELHQVPAAEDPFAPLDAGVGRVSPAVRPRILPTEKPKDAAQASLRQSAAVGEQYLNNLLTAGLLELPNIRVKQVSYDVTPDRKWGRSARRLFTYLFVILIATVGGGGFWYWYAGNQQRKDVQRHIALALTSIESGDYADLQAANDEIRAALDKDKDNLYTLALLAETTSLSSLLYGEYDPAEVARAIGVVAAEVDAPGEQGYRELVIARAANTLATLSELEDAESQLEATRTSLQTWLKAAPEDRLAQWLLGRAHLAAGARKAARAAFEAAHANGEGPAIAAIALADMHLDEGDFAGAIKLFDAALGKSSDHPFAFVGRSLARTERRAELGEAMGDLSVGLANAKGPRLVAYKQLALAFAHYAQQSYEDFEAALDEAKGVAEPRFLARLGLARMLQGRIVEAARVRADVTWHAAEPEPHPLVTLLDGELLLARGLPAEALKLVEGKAGLRATSLRGRALFELGRAEEALAAFDEALAIAPEAEELQVWAQASRMIATSGEVRDKADEALDSLGRAAESKAPRYVHGVALVAVGRAEQARDKLEQSLDGISAQYPNPLAYRSHVALAELDLAAGQREAALGHLEKALEINPGFLPARDLMGQVLADSDPDKARAHLVDVIDAGVASAGAELALVAVLMPSKKGDDVAAATAAIERAKNKGASTEALQAAIAELGDDGLYEALGVPEPGERRRRR